ncbi:MAG: LysR family transcriptional regulator [Schleiferilactobacillus perolens]|uniref:LysR family transcriptional regulator n=1 Tax=Schleiferilactobacillus perolens TaxID=100468 RepID=UPI0039EBC7CD
MELRVLRYFVTVVAERNISKAAVRLHVSQPTVSRQLQDLEEELGVQLLKRGSRAIELTPAGEYLVHQARQMLALADKTRENIHQSQEISGRVLIGAAEAPMMRTVARAIHHLNQIAPKVQVQLISTDANDVHERMQAGVFDFGVVMEPTDKAGYQFTQLPGTTRWGVLVPRQSDLGQKQLIHPADLQGQRLIVSQQYGAAALIKDWLGTSAIQYTVAATYNLLYNASLLATAEVGSVVCLDGIINTAGTDLIFVPFDPSLTVHASLIWPGDMPLSPAATAFLQAIRQQTAPDTFA